MLNGGSVGPAGSLGLTVTRAGGKTDPVPVQPVWPALTEWPNRPASVREVFQFGTPTRGLREDVNEWRLRNLPNLWRGVRRVMAARALNLPHFYGQLWLSKVTGDGEVIDFGLASMRVVTTAGVRYICDDMNNASGSADVTLFKFHGFGTGTTNEAASQTALVTELTTEYATDSTRPTGSQASATVSADATYTTVGTLSPDSGGTLAITEHGIFSANAAGTLLDRSKFAAVNLVAGSDSLQASYVLTLASGS